MTDTTTDEVTETPEPEERKPCLCGCGQIPTRKRSRFMPGHDAQFKSRLYATIRDEEADEADRQDAVQTLDQFGWPQPAPKRSRAKKTETTDETDGDNADA